MNLLKETITALLENGRLPTDVLWVGSQDGTCFISWEDFSKISDIDYDNGYGGAQIPEDLVIVGSDWWLERGEYDGSEWWEFKTLPEAAQIFEPFSEIYRIDLLGKR
jgi:hypothetical protein